MPNKVCGGCGAAFYTNVGLDEHVRLVCSNGRTTSWTRRTRLHPWLVEAVTRVNAQRRTCDQCGLTSTPAALGSHQRTTRHTGWSEP